MLEPNNSLHIDDLPNGVIVVQDGGGILAVNSAMLEMLRCERSWLLGRPLSDVLTRPAALLYHASFYQQLRVAAHMTETYLDFRTRDGADVPTVCTARMRHRQGVTDVVISATRMTERKRIEEDLLRTRRITEQIPGAVYEYMLRADGTRCIPYASESLRDMFGLTPAQVASDATPLLATLHPDDVPTFGLSIQGSADRLQPWRHQFRARRAPTAAYRWLEGTAAPARHADGATVWHGFVQDITDRKLVEDAIREKAAADQANQAKSEFLGRASHELRTPLNAILGFAQILSLDKRHPLLSVQQERLSHIEEAGRDLLHLIDDVLDLTRVESGSMRLRPIWIDLREQVQRVVRLVEGPASLKGVRLDIQVPEALQVFADSPRLGQVLTNLLTNAIKYNKQAGSVLITGAAEGDRVVLSIKDTGSGLTEDQVEHLFEPFNRLGAERSNIQGTGLGLVIVKRLVEAMDGSIVVSSTPGVGSTFRILLPIHSTLDSPSPSTTSGEVVLLETSAPLHSSAARVLYVEDNPINACVMEAIFDLSDGVDLHVESTGRAALDWICKNEVDLMLLDMHLPDYDGIPLLHDIRLACPHDLPPAIAVSADASPGLIEAARLAGFIDYWTKPLDATKTLRLLTEALRSDRNITSA